jgi:transcriptional regulator with XRE-family HTH domain
MANNQPIRPYRQPSHWRRRLTQLMNNPSENSQVSEINVGQRLQKLRIMRGYSQRALAEMSGLNFNTLSLIENEKTSPNVSTLQQLADALNVPVTAFFESTTAEKDVVFQKSGSRPKTSFPQGIVEDLGGGMSLGEATPLLMTLAPGEASDPDTILHSGQEFIFCLEGLITFWVGEDEYHLKPGDSLIFEADLPHRWENSHDEISRSILIICPSDKEDRSVVQHIL